MGMKRHIAGLAALAVGVALHSIIVTPELALFRASSPHFGVPRLQAPSFEQIAPRVYRMDAPWYITPWHKETLDLFAVQLDSSRWTVSDAGGYDTWLHPHTTGVLRAVEQLVGPGGELSFVLLSHGHSDHVGALPQLLKRFPGCRVVYHDAETPYLIHGRSWTGGPWWRGGSPGLWLAHALGMLPRYQNVVPADRTIALKGSSGSLDVHGLKGLSWHHTPGHAPSHVIYIHASTGIALGGDLADLVQDPPGVAALPDGRALAPGQPALYTLTVMDGANATVARASLCRVAYDTRMAWTTIRLYHDATKQGLTRAAFQKLAEAAAHCNGKA